MLTRYLTLKDASIINALFLEMGSIILLACLLEIVLKKKKYWAYIVVNSVISFFLFSITVYQEHFGRIINYSFLKQMTQLSTISESVLFLIEPVYLLYFLDIVIAVPILLYDAKKRDTVRKTVPQKSYLYLGIVMLFTTAGLMFHGLNQESLTTKEMAIKVGIINYELLEFMPSDEVTDIASEEITPELINKIKGNTSYNSTGNEEFYGIAQAKNILVIQVESLQNFPLDLIINDKNLMPNLKKLRDESIYLPNFFQQIGQGNTSDAEYLLNTSIYPLAEDSIAYKYAHKEIPALPRFLKGSGYETLTFHANDITFWNRNKLYPALGFDKYYDKGYFGVGDIIGIGASDEVVFKKAVHELKRIQDEGKKFYANIITLTSHHPFQLPADKTKFSLPSEYKDTLTGNYLEMMHYVDTALGQLITDLKNNGLWEDTALIIYGDHFGIPADTISDSEKGVLKSLLKREYTCIDMLNVPLIIKIPGECVGEVKNVTGGQVDLMPTILNLLGIESKDKILFGQDLLNTEENCIGIRYYLPAGSFINNDVLYISNGQALDLKTKNKVLINKKYEALSEKVKRLTEVSDAYLYYLPVR